MVKWTVNKYLSDLVPGAPCYTTPGTPFICLLARACLLSSQFDFISGIQRFKLSSSEPWYSISQVSFCKQTSLLVVQAVISLHVPPFGLTYLSEAHRAHLSFHLRTSCGSDLPFYSLKNQSRVIDWVSWKWPFIEFTHSGQSGLFTQIPSFQNQLS